ncbi:MAG: CoA transferase [Thermoleophilaceae bacterium]
MTKDAGIAPNALEGLKVIDCATLFAGPLIASLFADYGADVLKIEHPRGDALRTVGESKDGVGLWWTVASRNKRCITLKLSDPDGAELLKRLVEDADVLIENFRPGTLERWGLDPELLREINPRLVVVRTTGFGQTGPYASLPGFGTLAESLSGFAYCNGWPDRPPTLPPFALGDTVAALVGAFATLAALSWRDRSGEGQIIDLSIYEALFWALGPQATVYDQLGIVQERSGNASKYVAPRNAYQAKDGRWLGLSATTQAIAERVMIIVGREDLIEEPWFADHTGRVEHVDELDEIIGAWIGERTTEEVLEAFAEYEGAIAPMHSIADIVKDPQYLARETITRVDHPQLGSLLMQNVVPRLSATPGRIEHPGLELGQHNAQVYLRELGLDEAELTRLKDAGVV